MANKDLNIVLGDLSDNQQANLDTLAGTSVSATDSELSLRCESLMDTRYDTSDLAKLERLTLMDKD